MVTNVLMLDSAFRKLQSLTYQDLIGQFADISFKGNFRSQLCYRQSEFGADSIL